MTFVTNFLLALPSIGFIILGFVFLALLGLAYAEKRKQCNVQDIKTLFKYFGFAVIGWMIISALFSPVFFPKNQIDKFETNHLELRMDDELRSLQETKDRVPKPEKRELFVHELGKQKE